MTVAEVSAYLRLTPGALYSQRHRGVAPGSLGIRVGKKLLWRPEDIDAFLQRQANEERNGRRGSLSAEEELSRTNPKLYTIWHLHRGICGICHEYVEPMSATTDHIKPRSAGGTNDPANLQLAHFGCNTRKGARTDWGRTA